MKVKYSIALPTLNGAETLETTIPAILDIDFDDFELVVSDNCSEDSTWELINSFDDPRLVPVQSDKRLCIGDHLDFAYSKTSGEWLSHIGDDDLIFRSRFHLFDKALEITTADVVRGEFVRYTWPDYLNPNLRNTIDPFHFDGSMETMAGGMYARQLVNSAFIYAGGCWIVKRSLYDRVVSRFGHYSSSQHVEFFTMRAACALADQVCFVKAPVLILGRHEKSAGTQAFRPKGESRKKDWNWDFEVPQMWEYSPFKFFGYIPLSLDAALLLRREIPEVVGDVVMNWPYWLFHIEKHLDDLIAAGKLPPDSKKHLENGRKEISRELDQSAERAIPGDIQISDFRFAGIAQITDKNIVVVATARPGEVLSTIKDLSKNNNVAAILHKEGANLQEFSGERFIFRGNSLNKNAVSELELSRLIQKVAAENLSVVVVMNNDTGQQYQNILSFLVELPFKSIVVRQLSGNYLEMKGKSLSNISSKLLEKPIALDTHTHGSLVRVKNIRALAEYLDCLIMQ